MIMQKLAHIYNVGADHGLRILTVYYSFEVVSAQINLKALPARVIV